MSIVEISITIDFNLGFIVTKEITVYSYVRKVNYFIKSEQYTSTLFVLEMVTSRAAREPSRARLGPGLSIQARGPYGPNGPKKIFI